MAAPHPLEVIENPELEAAEIAEIAQLAIQLLNKRYPEGKVLRGVHPKSHGCLRAKFTVLDDVPPELRVGLWERLGTTFDAFVRFSNADSLVRHDLRGGKHGSRGMAIKVRNVPGPVLYQDGDEATQDFLMINTDQFAFVNVTDYLRLQKILLDFDDDSSGFFGLLQEPPPTDDPEQMAMFLRAKRTFDVASLIGAQPVANPVEVPYFGASPYAFGEDRAMRFSVVPVGPKKPQVVSSDANENYLREALTATMGGTEDVVFDFKIQTKRADDADLHIEDATQRWPEETAPPVTVARLTLPAPQTEFVDCERLFFSPWHAPDVHRPIGGINRLRRAVYQASADRRRAQ